MRALILFLAIALPGVAASENSLPEEMFGFKLGQTFKLREDGILEGAPINKSTALDLEYPYSPFLLYYFEPAKQYPGFEYIEYREDGDEPYASSFVLSLFPVRPDGMKFTTQTDWSGVRWEVIAIGWQTELEDDEKDEVRQSVYVWAGGLCKSLQSELGIDPAMDFDYGNPPKIRGCTFEAGDRGLDIGWYGGHQYVLGISMDMFEEKYYAAMAFWKDAREAEEE